MFECVCPCALASCIFDMLMLVLFLLPAVEIEYQSLRLCPTLRLLLPTPRSSSNMLLLLWCLLCMCVTIVCVALTCVLTPPYNIILWLGGSVTSDDDDFIRYMHINQSSLSRSLCLFITSSFTCIHVCSGTFLHSIMCHYYYSSSL